LLSPLGADGKVRQLDELYPHLRKQEPTRGTSSTIVAPGELLDLATVIKVSQAVSGEMVPEKLIERIMRAAIEHAGGERGLLIRPLGDELQIEAEATITGKDVTVHLRDTSETAAMFPESVVRYVARTRKDVILDDATAGNPFSGDPYIARRRARSIVCLPLVNQGRLNGIIFLENNLTAHAFTADRITVLKVLASQAAISLENTRLYRDLENREKRSDAWSTPTSWESRSGMPRAPSSRPMKPFSAWCNTTVTMSPRVACAGGT